ncbi:exodeoxyribonuclease VII large subunit [soil metagenome]
MELFSDLDESPAPAPPRGPEMLTVSALTRRVRSLLENAIGEVWVEGEISNLRKQASGHQYFTLKDERAQLSCVLFRGDSQGLGAALAEGMQIQVFGELSVYEARGNYQLIVRIVQGGGQGALQARFEALKRKLDAEGLFSAAHKRPIPKCPSTVGVVTSPTGAAIRDILHILSRRAPWVRVLVHPVRVQGAGAELEIARAIGELDNAAALGLPQPDLIIVGRGGGSIEDLWNFNEESVARSIFDCRTPVISAVGHEIDFTIADFVADLRAPTPSAAAELAVPDRAELASRIASLRSALLNRTRATLDHWAKVIGLLSTGSLVREPRRILSEHRQSIDHLSSALAAAARDQLSRNHRSLADLRSRLEAIRPDHLLAERQGALALARQRLQAATRDQLARQRDRLANARSLLRTLDPQAVLGRGFSLTLGPEGSPLRDATSVQPGDQLTTRLANGLVASTVNPQPATPQPSRKTKRRAPSKKKARTRRKPDSGSES